jgi:hypothetical protein
MKKYLIISLLSIACFDTANAADPSYLKLKIYKIAVSTSNLCTNLITIYNNSAAEYKDVLQGASLGSGAISPGTYPCVVMEMSDNIKYATGTTTGTCTADTDYTFDVCGNGTTNSVLIDGTAVTCNGSVDNTVAIYISTASTWTTGSGEPFTAPTVDGDTDSGVQLGSALVLATGSSRAKFVVNGTGKVDGSGGQCEMQPPAFSFVKL